MFSLGAPAYYYTVWFLQFESYHHFKVCKENCDERVQWRKKDCESFISFLMTENILHFISCRSRQNVNKPTYIAGRIKPRLPFGNIFLHLRRQKTINKSYSSVWPAYPAICVG